MCNVTVEVNTVEGSKKEPVATLQYCGQWGKGKSGGPPGCGQEMGWEVKGKFGGDEGTCLDSAGRV